VRTRFTLNKDHLGALLLIALGIGVVVLGNGYRMGTLTTMGAGFIPVVLGGVLVVVGAVLGLTAGTAASSPKAEARHPPEWRGWLCILGGVAAFVVLGNHGGLVPAAFASVFISAMGDRKNTLKGAALLAAAMTVAGVLIFSVGLHLQLPLFQWV